MAKQVKDRWLGARVDAATDKRVSDYTEAAEINMGDLVRDAVNEYIINHPVKNPLGKVDVSKLNKPGE